MGLEGLSKNDHEFESIIADTATWPADRLAVDAGDRLTAPAAATHRRRTAARAAAGRRAATRPPPPTRDPNTPGYVAAKELPDGADSAGGR